MCDQCCYRSPSAALILWHTGVFGKFWFWTFDYASKYASIISVSEANSRFWLVLPVIASSTALLWLLAAAGMVLAWFDGRMRGSRLWLLGFSVSSGLTVFPGFYFRAHYFLATLPAVALLAGCSISGIIWLHQKTGPSRTITKLVDGGLCRGSGGHGFCQ